jgi:hypothetical protein
MYYAFSISEYQLSLPNIILFILWLQPPTLSSPSCWSHGRLLAKDTFDAITHADSPHTRRLRSIVLLRHPKVSPAMSSALNLLNLAFVSNVTDKLIAITDSRPASDHHTASLSYTRTHYIQSTRSYIHARSPKVHGRPARGGFTQHIGRRSKSSSMSAKPASSWR